MNERDIGHLLSSTYYPKKSNNYSVIDVTWRNMDKHVTWTVPRENHQPDASPWQNLFHNDVSSTPCHVQDSNSEL
jgi:hypothetical protein